MVSGGTPQSHTRSRQAAHHRPQRNIQDFCGVVVAQSLADNQHQDRTLVRRQILYGPLLRSSPRRQSSSSSIFDIATLSAALSAASVSKSTR